MREREREHKSANGNCNWSMEKRERFTSRFKRFGCSLTSHHGLVGRHGAKQFKGNGKLTLESAECLPKGRHGGAKADQDEEGNGGWAQHFFRG